VVAAGSISARLRAALAEQGWSYTRLIAAMRRTAAVDRETLPKTESLVTTISRWLNDHERPNEFYQDLLCKALRKSRVQLGFEDASDLQEEGGAEPEDLAQVLEASNVGPLTVSQLEATAARLGQDLPSTPPVLLRRPLLEHYRRVASWLGKPQPIAQRRRLCGVAAQLAGMAGNVSFDLHDPGKAQAYYDVAMTAAGEADDDSLAAWVLANLSYLHAHRGTMNAALEAAQGAAARAAHSADVTTQHAWLAALEAELHASLGDAKAVYAALRRAERAVERARPEARRLGIDFFTPARLPAYMGSCYMLLGQAKLAQRFSSEALGLLGPRARSRWFVRLDLATTLVQQGELEEACSVASESLAALSGDDWTPRLEQRARDFQRTLEPFATAGAVQTFNEEFRTPGGLL
jgi:tetratricopeptide (TPR) repeat protein